MKYPYIRPNNKKSITSSSKISYLPLTQSRNERNTNTIIWKITHNTCQEKNRMLKIPTTCYFNDTSSSSRSNELNHGNLLKTSDVFSKKHQLAKVCKGLKK